MNVGPLGCVSVRRRRSATKGETKASLRVVGLPITTIRLWGYRHRLIYNRHEELAAVAFFLITNNPMVLYSLTASTSVRREHATT